MLVKGVPDKPHSNSLCDISVDELHSQHLQNVDIVMGPIAIPATRARAVDLSFPAFDVYAGAMTTTQQRNENAIGDRRLAKICRQNVTSLLA